MGTPERLAPQPIEMPVAGAITRLERPPSTAELAQWHRCQRNERNQMLLGGALMYGFFALGAGGPIGTLLHWLAPAWAIVGGAATGGAVFLFGLVNAVKALRQRGRDRAPDAVRVLELQLHDARAWHVDDGNKCEGWLFVLDRERSLYWPGQCIWLPPEHEDEDDVVEVAPTSVRFVLAAGDDDAWSQLSFDEQGPLRIIPCANREAADEVAASIAGWPFGQIIGLVPTPGALLTAIDGGDASISRVDGTADR